MASEGPGAARVLSLDTVVAPMITPKFPDWPAQCLTTEQHQYAVYCSFHHGHELSVWTVSRPRDHAYSVGLLWL